MSQQAELEDRVTALEQTLERILERARKHPTGRQILKILGLS